VKPNWEDIMDATLLIDACKELGYPVRSYSGRGMYDIRQDSLGLGTILYFPYVEWPKDMPEDDEEFENEEND